MASVEPIYDDYEEHDDSEFTTLTTTAGGAVTRPLDTQWAK